MYVVSFRGFRAGASPETGGNLAVRISRKDYSRSFTGYYRAKVGIIRRSTDAHGGRPRGNDGDAFLSALMMVGSLQLFSIFPSPYFSVNCIVLCPSNLQRRCQHIYSSMCERWKSVSMVSSTRRFADGKGCFQHRFSLNFLRLFVCGSVCSF